MKRRGRPPLPYGERREALFAVRMRPADVALIQHAARLDGKYNVSDWARDVLVDMAKVVIDEKTTEKRQ